MFNIATGKKCHDAHGCYSTLPSLLLPMQCSATEKQNDAEILFPAPKRKLLLLPAGLRHFTLSPCVSLQPKFHSSFWPIFHPRHAVEEAENKRKEGKKQTAWREKKVKRKGKK